MPPQRALLLGRRATKISSWADICANPSYRRDKLLKKNKLIITARFLATERSSPFTQVKEASFCFVLNKQGPAFASLHGAGPCTAAVTGTQTPRGFEER